MLLTGIAALALSTSAHAGGGSIAGQMLGKTFFLETSLSQWDTLGWEAVEKLEDVKPSSTKSPKGTCAGFAAAGKSVLKVKNPSSVCVAILRNLGYHMWFLTHWGSVSNLESVLPGTDGNYVAQRPRTDLLWERLERLEITKPGRINDQLKIKFYFEQGGVNFSDGGAPFVNEMRQIVGTTEGLVLQEDNGLRFEDQVVKRTVLAVYLIVPAEKAAKPKKLVAEIEDGMDRLGLDLSYKAPEIVPICK
jgi:hypothetical protein